MPRKPGSRGLELLKRPSLFAHGLYLRDSMAACEHLFEHLLWQFCVCPSGCCLPRPTVESHTRSRLPCQRSSLRELAGSGSAFASAGWTPRGDLLPKKRSFFVCCQERLGLRAKVAMGKTVAHFDKLLCLPARRSKPVLPSERRGPERGTIEQTKTGRPTQVAQADGWRSFKRRRPLVVLASGSGGGLHGPLA